jgi:ribosome-associated protein
MHIAEYALTKKAQNVCLMDLRGLSSVTDYFVICHGESDLQVKAIADAIVEGMRDEGVKPWHKEGYDHSNWIILDYIDIVVHVFKKEARDFYGLERLWGDAEMEAISE